MQEIKRQIGHFRILSRLGTGGMGEVYLAEDERLDRKIAIKLLSEEFSRDEDKLRRFVQEAKAASALNHPNILTVYEIGETDGRKYIATEFIEGKTLSEQLSGSESRDLKTVLKIGIQVAEALSAAHEAGIIHRDIKPENIMVRKDGYVKVLDFGLAKLTEKKKTDSVSSEIETKALVQTNPGVVMGTVNYMSPEQARGKPTDARTDIWSLGVVLYEILSGRLPFAGETISHTIVAIMEKDPEPLKNVPEELQRIIHKTLAKDPEMRYQTAKDLLIDLKSLRKTLAIQGELERSGSPNRVTVEDTLYDGKTRFYSENTYEELNRSKIAEGESKNPAKWLLAFAALLIAAGAAWWYFAGKTDGELPAKGFVKTVEIASWSSGPNELIVEAAFSPDAKMIAYGSARSGANEIWVKPVSGGEPIQVTTNGFYNQYPVWSPNGQELAYFSSRGDKRGIWRTSFTGGEQAQITSDVNTGAKPRYWSKSGKIYIQERFDLFSVDEKTGEKKQITDFESSGLQPRTTEISADESKVAFSIKEDDLYKLKVRDLASGQITEAGVSKDQMDFLAWHPDGKNVLYSATVEGVYQIFKAPAAGGGEPIQLSTGNFDFFVEDVSADGKRILFWSQNENSDLWAVDTEGSKETLLADSTAAEYWAAVSPDGKSAAFQAVSKVNRPFSGSVNTASLSGERKNLMISAGGFSPAWSQNGEWVTFFKRAGNEIEIWRANPNGGDELRLASGGIQTPGYSAMPYLKIGTNHLTFPPDQNAVAYAARKDGRSNIRLVSPDGQRDEQITANEDPNETLCCPAWTADGAHFIVPSVYRSPAAPGSTINRLWLYKSGQTDKKKIFETKDEIRFLGIENGGKDAVVAVVPPSKTVTTIPESVLIYLVSLETGAASRVNELNAAYTHNIHLSPDGKLLAFVSRRDKITELWTIPVRGGEPRRLLVENDPKIYISSLSWSPDGKTIVFGRQSQNSLLSMLVE